MDSGITVMAFFLKREREMKKMAKAPLSCKFKCGRDVPANLNVRRWMDTDIQNMGRAKPGSGRREWK